MSETVTEAQGSAESTPSIEQARPTGLSDYLQTAGGSINRYGLAAGVLLIVLISVIWIFWNWGTWGDLSTDCGREVYVSVVIKDGGTLYRDVWYPFGPISPYVNAALFRWFGISIFVPYVVGAICALGSAIFIFLSGIEVGFPLAGWAAGAALAMQAFEPGWSSFPLPYSSAAVYSSLFSCAFLWLLLRGLGSGGWWWSVSLSLLAAMSLLSKPEFGLACYPILLAAIVYRGIYERSWKRAAKNLAGALPGIALFVAVFSWMVSLHGWAFITEENILMWPGSYFMRTFGREWLATTGFDLSWPAVSGALIRTVLPLGIWILLRRILAHWRGANTPTSFAGTAIVLAGLVAYWWRFPVLASSSIFIIAVFFPMPMVAYTILGGLAAAAFLSNELRNLQLARLVLLAGFAGLLAFRILFKSIPQGYPVFYNGSVVLAYLILLSVLLSMRQGRVGKKFRLEYIAIAGCLVAVAIVSAAPSRAKAQLVPVQTDFGTVRVSRRAAQRLEAAVAFLKDKNARGESVMLVPEDTMLYVLSSTRAPTRVNAFVPGILVPGKMTEELFKEIDCKPVQHLLWSNREFSEYGVPILGRDFNQEFVRFLTSRFKPVAPLVPQQVGNAGTTFVIWQREDGAPNACAK